jgi:hypothetical protein
MSVLLTRTVGRRGRQFALDLGLHRFARVRQQYLAKGKPSQQRANGSSARRLAWESMEQDKSAETRQYEQSL